MSSNKTRIVVLGSLNMDVVLRCDTMPARGETVHAQSLSYIPGGKGGNQAVACARHGAQVALVGAVGRDAHGEELRNALVLDGIDVSHVAVHDGVATGSAVVMVEQDGSNRIAVIPGANALADLPASFAETLKASDFLVVQFETPLDVLDRAMAVAHAVGCRWCSTPRP